MLRAEETAGIPHTRCTLYWQDQDRLMLRQMSAAAAPVEVPYTGCRQRRSRGIETAQGRAEEDPGWGKGMKLSQEDALGSN